MAVRLESDDDVLLVLDHQFDVVCSAQVKDAITLTPSHGSALTPPPYCSSSKRQPTRSLRAATASAASGPSAAISMGQP